MKIEVELPEVTCARCSEKAQLPPHQIVRLPVGTPGGAVDEDGRSWRVVTEARPPEWVPHPSGLLCPPCGVAWAELAAGFLRSEDATVEALVEIAKAREKAPVVVLDPTAPPLPFWQRGAASPISTIVKPPMVQPPAPPVVQAKLCTPLNIPQQITVSGPMLNAPPRSMIAAAPPPPSTTVSAAPIIAPPQPLPSPMMPEPPKPAVAPIPSSVAVVKTS